MDEADLVIRRIETQKAGQEAKAIKNDTGKPPLSMVSRELMVALAEVRKFGAEKYTRYKPCDCVMSLIAAKSIIVKANAKTTTTLGSSPPIQDTNSDKSKITNTGQKKTECVLITTAKSEEETPQQLDTEYPGNISTRCSTGDASSAETKKESLSTTATKQERLEAPFASLATSVLGGSKNQDLQKKHENTCASLEIEESGRDNWRKGFKYTRSADAALRHIFAFLDGEDMDPESGLPHIAHAVASLEHLLYDFKYRPDNDDRARI